MKSNSIQTNVLNFLYEGGYYNSRSGEAMA